MKQSYYSIADLWASLIVEELVRHSICSFCLSPGSRNTPLVAAVATNKRAEHVVHYDERGAGFFALGLVRATMKPVVLICTSGSAVANYLPAIIEADNDNLPLIVLSADRPPELRGSGANQTIDQVHLFGNRVRSFVDLPCPNVSVPPSNVLSTIDQVISKTIGSKAGPVHINCMFREPLTPIGEQEDFSEYLQPLAGWLEGNKRYTYMSSPVSMPQLHDLKRIGDLLNDSKCGVIVVGQLPSTSDTAAIVNFIKQLRWPLFADIASQLRVTETVAAVPHIDLILSSERFINEHQPDCVLHLGGRIVSKRLQQWLESSNPTDYIHINQYERRIDPGNIVTEKLVADIPIFCDLITPFISDNSISDDWSSIFKVANQTVENGLTELFDNSDELSEPSIARSIISHLPDKSALFVASSMPVRDLNSFAPIIDKDIVIGCNRGASGIDGTIASAVGFFRATDQPGTLLIGDLAFLHDLNSLQLLKNVTTPVTIVLINNNGGGIFSFLPIAKRDDIFDQFFGTPHNLSFESAATMFGLHYNAPVTMNEFVDSYTSLLKSDTVSLIECRTDRIRNHDLHRQIQTQIVAVLDKKAN